MQYGAILVVDNTVVTKKNSERRTAIVGGTWISL